MKTTLTSISARPPMIQSLNEKLKAVVGLGKQWALQGSAVPVECP